MMRPKDWKYAIEHAVFKKMTRRQARIASENLLRTIHREYFGRPDDDKRGLIWAVLQAEYDYQRDEITGKEVKQEFAYYLARILNERVGGEKVDGHQR